MKFVRAVGVLTLATLAFTACDDESTTGVVIADFAGLWTATQFEYSDNTTPLSVDVIAAPFNGSVTLDVNENGSFTGSLRIPGLTVDPTTGETITLPIGGTITLLDEDNLRVDFDQQTESYNLFGDFNAEFELSGDIVTFVNDDTSFDFPAAIEQAAGIDPTRGAVSATLSVTLQR